MVRCGFPRRFVKNSLYKFFLLTITIAGVVILWEVLSTLSSRWHYGQAVIPGPDKLTCVQPVLSLDDPVMMKLYKKVPRPDCKGQKDFVYVENGTLRFTKEKLPSHKCDMYPLHRGRGDYNVTYGGPIEDVQDKTPLVSEFFKVKCNSGGGKKKTKKDGTTTTTTTVYENLHLGVHYNASLKERSTKSKLPADGLGLSVVMLGFDSMSRMSWLRRMPKTRDYFVNALGAIELEGYNIMGDGTPAALFPILTGKHEQELPEARRKFRGAKTVDGFPWIWKDFRRNGYITSWADAEVNIAPFNYRLLGFAHEPTDLFMRPFYLAVDPTYSKYTSGCHGSVPKHQHWFNFVRDIHHMYQADPKFLFHFYATLSHNDNNPISSADEDLLNLVSTLEKDGYLNNTLLVLFADHGSRFYSARATLSGKLEERMPYFSLRFPPWFREQYPKLMDNLKTNSKRLTTPMDIHETLKDILHYSGGSPMGNSTKRGISLFKEIPKQRTCGQADVAPHWCSCLQWISLNPYSSNGKKALQKAVDTINGFTSEYRSDCAELKIENVTEAVQIQTSDSVLKFKQTTGDRGLEPVLNDKRMKLDKILYQLTFFTTPGAGQFEVTVEHSLKTQAMTVHAKAISRINKYGNAPACILGKNRDIRQYCYCNQQHFHHHQHP